ncbi:hypothetical protein PJN21_29750, partial [Mycobacterium kansasii]
MCSSELSPDGRRIVSGSDDKTLRLWRSEARRGGQECARAGGGGGARGAWSPEGGGG